MIALRYEGECYEGERCGLIALRSFHGTTVVVRRGRFGCEGARSRMDNRNMDNRDKMLAAES